MNPVIFLLALCGAMSGMAQRSVEPMLPRLASEFGTDVPSAANVITLYAMSYAAAQLFHGPLGDRFGKLRIITLMLLASTFCFAGCALSPDLPTLVAWRAVTGITASASVLLGVAYLGDTVPMAGRGPILAYYMTGTVFGHALGPLIGGGFTDLIGWRAAFVFLAIAFGSVGAVLWLSTRSRWNAEPRSTGPIFAPARFAEVLRLPRARFVIVCALLETLLFFGAFSYLGAMLKERFEISYTLIGLTLSGFGIGGLVFAGMVKWLLGRFNSLQLVVAGGLMVCACYGLLAALPVWWPMLPCSICLGLGFNMLHNGLQIRATEMAPRARGVSMSLFSFSWSLGQGIGVALMGLGVGAFGYAPMLAAFGVLFALFAAGMRYGFIRWP